MFNTARILMTLATVSSLGLAACASDPNKEIKEAHEEKSADQREYQVTQAEVNRDQSTDQNKLDKKQVDQRVDKAADHQKELTNDNQKIVEANTKMAEDRRNASSKATERLNKADISANEYLAKAKSLSAPKKASFDGAWTGYTKARDNAQAKAKLTNDATNEGWAQAKVDIDRSLDDLDKSVDELKRTSSK